MGLCGAELPPSFSSRELRQGGPGQRFPEKTGLYRSLKVAGKKAYGELGRLVSKLPQGLQIKLSIALCLFEIALNNAFADLE